MNKFIKIDAWGVTQECDETEAVDYFPAQSLYAEGEFERAREDVENLKSFVQAMFDILTTQQQEKVAEHFGFELVKEEI